MATQPLPSPLPTPSSSRRTSTDTLSSSPARLPHRRGNRAALRDYYGLKSAGPVDVTGGTASTELGLQHEDADIKESELDREGFDAEEYVKIVLAREGLEGLLLIEGNLVNEIKGLDGERKALVYDNYSKLITATDTIRKMRTNMDPLTPTTSTLSPAIAHIVATVAALATSLQERSKVPKIIEERGTSTEKDSGEKMKQVQTVKWVLGAPRRLREELDSEDRDVAEKDWAEVKKLLEKWRGTGGVEDVMRECEAIMKEVRERG